MTAVALHASDLSHSFGTVQALAGVSVEVRAGDVLALVGESGSGKTTLLRTFNRMVEPARGRVCVEGQDVAALDPVALRRRIGYVPQSGGLLPHWTVLRNVALVPDLVRIGAPLDAAARALALVGLPVREFGDRYPRQLSGGQRQRVALARALAAQQQIVLLDEPFGALDAISRNVLHEVFARLRRELAFTAILVTHDLSEAAQLADAIAVMRAGRIEQLGSFQALRNTPETPYVASLMQQASGSLAFLSQHA